MRRPHHRDIADPARRAPVLEIKAYPLARPRNLRRSLCPLTQCHQAARRVRPEPVQHLPAVMPLGRQPVGDNHGSGRIVQSRLDVVEAEDNADGRHVERPVAERDPAPEQQLTPRQGPGAGGRIFAAQPAVRCVTAGRNPFSPRVPGRPPSRPTRCPPSLTSVPPARSTPTLSPMASTTWPAAVRPKRASHACGSGSEFSIVPVATPSAIRAPDAFESRNVSVSSPSSWTSSRSATFTVFAVSPGRKVSVPVLAP